MIGPRPAIVNAGRPNPDRTRRIAAVQPLRQVSVFYRTGEPSLTPLTKEPPMTIAVVLQPLVALIAGILILLVPRLLNFIVAIYLIIVGLAGLLPHVMR